MERRSALLVLGATGTGKTPLGEYLERNGLNGRRCVHFDFGSRLRAVADGSWRAAELSEDDAAFVRGVLESNALLEDSEFYIAKNILLSFLEEKEVSGDDVVVLNGLPRHTGQAEDMADLVDIGSVTVLDCSPEIVHQRVNANSGGDRTDRTDDSFGEIENKLRIFRERTMPLLDYFGARGADIVKVNVGVDTVPADIVGLMKK